MDSRGTWRESIVAAAREALSLARSTPFHAKDFSALLDHWTSRSG